METVQSSSMCLCLAALAAICLFGLVCFAWRRRLRNAAVAALAAALAFAAVPKNRDSQLVARDSSAAGRAARPRQAAMPGESANALPFHVPEVYGHWLSGILFTTNGTVEVTASREEWMAYDATNLTLLASPRYEDRTMWGPLAEMAFAAGETTAVHTAAVPVFPGYASAFIALADASLDTDGDGVADWREAVTYGTDPSLADTDGDGVPDAAELVQGTNPLESGDAPEQPP
ncbi:MAG: hypothetical protein IKL96_12610, partial [Kiritimatiellae bacterium]|nr:hypothetical protein [Kiritimatiellia bacterium]